MAIDIEAPGADLAELRAALQSLTGVVTFTAVKTAAYTFAPATDNGKVVPFNKATDDVITLPADAAVGDCGSVMQLGAGQAILVPDTGGTILNDTRNATAAVGSTISWFCYENSSGTSAKYIVSENATYVAPPEAPPVTENLFVNSVQAGYASPWSGNGDNWVQTDALAEDGTNTAAQLAGSGTNIYTGQYPTGLTNSADYVMSWYIRPHGSNPAPYVWLSLDTDGIIGAWFNTSTGAVGTQSTGVTGGSASAGNGFKRIWITRAANGTGMYARLGMSSTDNSNVLSGDNPRVYVWGPQLETGTTPTAYNPTT